MKHLIIILSLLINFSLYAQAIRDVKSLKNSVIPPSDAVNGDYFKDVGGVFDKFTGQWLYLQGSARVELSITKINRHHFFGKATGIFVDKLSVEFKYFENGILIKKSEPGFYTDLDQIQLLNILTNNEIGPIGPNNPYDYGFSVINGNYTEPFYSNCSRPQMGQLWLFYKTQNNIVNGVSTTGKLFWEVRTRALNRNMTGVTCADNYVLPANMVFIKQP